MHGATIPRVSATTRRRTLAAAIPACAVLALLLTTSSLALAAPGSNAAMAQSLFDEAKKLMAENDFAHACPKLAESQRLDPSGGTLLHLGICHVGEGKTATAYAELNEAISVARRDGRADRETAAKSQLAALQSKLTKLTITVPAEARVEGLDITWDGTPIREPQWGTPFPVDPGEHVVAAMAPARRKWSTSLRVEAAAAGASPPSVSIPVLAIDNGAKSNAKESGAIVSTGTQPGSDDNAPSKSNTTKVVGIALAGVGVVSLAVAGVLQLRTFSIADERDAAAVAGDQATRDEKHDSAKSSQLIAMILGGAGVVALGAGAVLFFTSSSSSSSSSSRAGNIRLTPFTTADSGGFMASGRF